MEEDPFELFFSYLASWAKNTFHIGFHIGLTFHIGFHIGFNFHIGLHIGSTFHIRFHIGFHIGLTFHIEAAGCWYHRSCPVEGRSPENVIMKHEHNYDVWPWSWSMTMIMMKIMTGIISIRISNVIIMNIIIEPLSGQRPPTNQPHEPATDLSQCFFFCWRPHKSDL